jgi:uncharacterized protein (TIGR03067 family)
MTRILAAAFLLPLASANFSAAESKAVDPAFVGTWEFVATTPVGAARGAKRLRFNSDGTYAALGADGKELWAGTYETDRGAIPKVWDHRSHEAKKKGTDVLGIYEVKGDTLKACCVIGAWKGKKWVGKPRPTSFDPKQAEVTLELKRVKRKGR